MACLHSFHSNVAIISDPQKLLCWIKADFSDGKFWEYFPRKIKENFIQDEINPCEIRLNIRILEF